MDTQVKGWDDFFPNVLPGSAGDVDPTIDVNLAIIQPAIVAMTMNPAGALAIAAIQQTPVPFADGNELGQSIVTALANHAVSFRDIPLRTHGHPYFDNRQTAYTGALPPAVLQAVNLGVERFDGSPSALNYLQNNTTPTGALRNPLLMLSTSRDPVVPGFHQLLYASRVALEGSSDLLALRTINRYGHCNFLPGELSAAFGDLVTWVELGVKP